MKSCQFKAAFFLRYTYHKKVLQSTCSTEKFRKFIRKRAEMKKLLLAGIVIVMAACNSDDSDQLTECTNTLWGIVENCSPDNTNCTYIATYGETQETAGSIITNQATYEYYTSLGNTFDGSICWDGTRD